MKIHLRGFFIAILTVSLPAAVQAAAQLAFPGAEGFGATATGGRAGTVYHVTNLNNSGAGSFRDAVSQPNRTVVFDVGGVINLTSQLVFSSNITVAGQTAPGEGIVLNGQGISMSNQSNIIVRYVRFRSSHNTSDGTKAVNITTGSNIILDHVDISWGRWDNLGFTSSAHDITIQNSIISEAINPQRLGALIDSSTNITVARNLWIDNQSRNPKGKAHMQYINNVVYNWGSSGYDGGHSGAVWNQDLINNYFIKGPSSNNSLLAQFTPTDHVYQTGNMVDLNRDGILNGVDVQESDFLPNDSTSGTATFMPTAYNNPTVPVSIMTALQAYSFVIANAGASLHRDSVDTRLINQLLSLGALGAVIDDETIVGGAGTIAGGPILTDTDQDGIPDSWESAHGLNPALGSDGNFINPTTGYTNLELYFNSLVPEPSFLSIAAVSIVLSRRRSRLTKSS
ncbi:MAG TPA: hypothetical protein VHD56_00410 [Tepidisphaeraceae bacterium]|nr:hypothetical protein [Tepidisphaeraceae bacterium]